MTDELLELMQEKLAEGLEKEKTKEAIHDWERTVLLTLKNGSVYHFLVADNTITILAGSIDNPDMQIQSDADTIRKLFLEETSAASALLKRKLKIKGSTSDLMKIRHIF